MVQQSLASNPFMLMIQPEAILAAVEKSERLGSLNRRLCRPLDRLPVNLALATDADADLDAEDEIEIDVDFDITH